MANIDPTIAFQLLSTNYADDSADSVSYTKKHKSWRRKFRWNIAFKIIASILIFCGAIAIGYGVMTTFWPISATLAVVLTSAALTVWAIGTFKGVFNTLASWGTVLEGGDRPLYTIDDTLKNIQKLIKQANKELALLNQQEQSNAKFLKLTQKLAKHDEIAAIKLRELYLQSAKQQINKYRRFSHIIKQIKRFNPKLANKLYTIYFKDNSLQQRETWLKAQQCYQLLAYKNKQLAKQLAELYIDSQQQENEINNKFQKLCTDIQKQQPELAQKLRKLSRKNHGTDLFEKGNQTNGKGCFKAAPCQINQTWTNSLLKEISAKQALVAKLLKKVDVQDKPNQERLEKYTKELAESIHMISSIYPQLRILGSAYQTFKTKLKESIRPLQQSFKQLGKTLKAHAPFKKRLATDASKQAIFTEQSKAANADQIDLDTSVAYAEQLDNHGLFSNHTSNDPVLHKEARTKNCGMVNL